MIQRDWHFTDEPHPEIGGRRKRMIQNWTNYRRPDGEFRATVHALESATTAKPMDAFAGLKVIRSSVEQPLQFFTGDPAELGGLPWWGMRWSDRRDADVLCFLDLGTPAQNDRIASTDSAKKSIELDVSDDVLLKLYVLPEKVEKWIVLMSERAGTSATVGYQLPEGWTLEVVDRSVLLFKDAKGEVVYKSKPAQAFDSNTDKDGPRSLPCRFDLVKTDKPPTLRGIPYWPVAVSCTPDRGAVWPILMDPTVTINNASTILDCSIQGPPDGTKDMRNGGISVFNASGNQAGNINRFRTLIYLPTASIPAGTITGLDYYLYIAGYTQRANVSFRAIASANAWVEGTKNNATAGTGEPCWTYRQYNTAGWAGLAGLEDNADIRVESSYPTWDTGENTVTQNTWRTQTLTPSWATKWRDGIWTNNGFVIADAAIPGNTYLGSYHYSQEYTTTSLRPYFVITYSLEAYNRKVVDPLIQPILRPTVRDSRGR
jgi:hypothetical protein